MRKLATVRIIDEINDIDESDFLEVATIGGWKIVVDKGVYSEKQKVIMVEIDSWIPTELAPFLSKGKEPSEFEGVKGERLRTVRLRGQLSQGLILPLEILLEHFQEEPEVGTDVTEILGIKKWERPVPTQLAGQVKGSFPSFIPKTDQERVQNLVSKVEHHSKMKTTFEATEKLNGSSMTVFLYNGEFGVCSRNLQLKIEGNETNAFIKAAKQYNLEENMRSLDYDGFAFQGELVGEGIQGNPYKINGIKFYVYNVYSIATQEYVKPRWARLFTEDLGLEYVPVLDTKFAINTDVKGLLEIAEGTSVLNEEVEREGIVFKSNSGDFSFKAISNNWLIKGGE